MCFYRFFGHRHYLLVVLLRRFVDGFKVEFSLTWTANFHKKSSKKRTKRPSMTRCKLGWMLEGSWIDFLSILGPFWGASWHQVDTKIQKKRVPKRCQKMSGKKLTRVSAGGVEGHEGNAVWALKSNYITFQNTPKQ